MFRTNNAPKYQSLDEIITEMVYTAIREGAIESIDELADDLAIGRKHLYRMLNPHDPVCSFPSGRMDKLIERTKNDAYLERLAHKRGYMLVKMPRGSMSHADTLKFISQYQGDFNKLIVKLIEYFQNQPSLENKSEILKAITAHLEQTAGLRQRVKKDTRQADMFEGQA